MEKKKCLRCNWEWWSRVEKPARCPHCNSPYWDKERVRPVRASVSELSVRQEEFASLVGANNFSVKKVAEIIGRSYQTAAKYINKWMPIPAECIERLRDYSIIHPPLSRELYKCQIDACGWEWAGKQGTPPAECPKCRSRFWDKGITALAARTRLRWMWSATNTTFPEFCQIVGISEEKLRPYFNGKPMNLEQLGVLGGILKAKGYEFREN